MRLMSALLVSALLTGSALAQSSSGNVGQPERAVPQAGNTTGGPLDNPSSRDMAPARTGAMPAGAGTGTGSVESAKGGNAQQNERAVPNTGNTSGGPAR